MLLNEYTFICKFNFVRSLHGIVIASGDRQARFVKFIYIQTSPNRVAMVSLNTNKNYNYKRKLIYLFTEQPNKLDLSTHHAIDCSILIILFSS